MSMTRREFEDFYEFCETLDFGNYDKVRVLDSSLGNAGDVPAEDKLECAKDTVLAFLDGAYDD
jgi:hypothetical protein